MTATINDTSYNVPGIVGHDPVLSGPVLFKWDYTEEGEWGTSHSLPLFPSLGPEATGQCWAYIEFRYDSDEGHDEGVKGNWHFGTFCDRTNEVTDVEIFEGTWADRERALAHGSRLAVEFLMTKLDERTAR